jgi:anaerobic magnesium-protoporphyrin IX monomethyl ester cyclase
VRVAVGPDGSATPRTALRKLEVDAVVLGECEVVLVHLAGLPIADRGGIAGLCRREHGGIVVRGGPQAADMTRLSALAWPAATLRRHHHHHHRFDAAPVGPGAEMETSRRCPYHCTPSAPRRIPATVIGAGRSRPCSKSSMG